MASSATKMQKKKSYSKFILRITLCEKTAASIRPKLSFQRWRLILAFISLPTVQPLEQNLKDTT